MHILLTGGGTAGHVLPNIAIRDVINEFSPETRITYIGSRHGIERRLCEEAGIHFEAITTGKLRRYFDLRNLLDLFKIPLGIVEAFIKLLKLRPKVVFSKGGYVAFPTVVSAWLIGIPVFIHESDALPGLTTRLCAPFAQKIFLGFEEAKESLSHYVMKTEVVGNPIRLDLYDGKLARAKKWSGFSGKKPVLLIMGGSSGSHELNEKIAAEKTSLLEEFDVIHITGEHKAKRVKQKNYIAEPYVGDELKDIYALASLALSRAGASALAELEALQIPALLFPLGLHASHGDQIANAEALCARSDLYRLLEANKPLRSQLLLLPQRPTQHLESGTTQKIALSLLSEPSHK